MNFLSVICRTNPAILLKTDSMKQLPEVFYKNDVLKNFTKFPENRLCQSLYFHKVEYLRPATLLKKRAWQRCFPVNCAKFLRTYFYRIPPDDCF